jgi:type I toxin-antitoxin system toxin SymE
MEEKIDKEQLKQFTYRYHYTMNRFRKLKCIVSFALEVGQPIPEIRLEGKWLDELGFKHGQIV